MSVLGKERCVHCRKPRPDAPLQKCPICFKLFCEVHEYEMSGRRFCGIKCAEFFFFVDPDDEDEDRT